MKLIYDKDGNEVKMPHAIDAKEWVATGEYFYEKPEEKPKVTRGKSQKQDDQNQ